MKKYSLVKNKKVSKEIYKKVKKINEEVIIFITKKEEEERELYKKNRKEISYFRNTKVIEKENICVENGGHFFDEWEQWEEDNYYEEKETITYYRNCLLCDFEETKELDYENIL